MLANLAEICSGSCSAELGRYLDVGDGLGQVEEGLVGSLEVDHRGGMNLRVASDLALAEES